MKKLLLHLLSSLSFLLLSTSITLSQSGDDIQQILDIMDKSTGLALYHRPSDYIKKSDSPVVCSLSRLDRRKRPELFMNLAEQFPDVQFISMGKSRDQKWEQYLGDKYKNVPNLKITGFIDQFSSNELSEILEQSWVMINTATREGLRNAFIESASHKCAILSFVDPDNFASEFGYHADKDDFKEGLKYLLENNRWKAFGEKGYAYIKDTFELDKSISRHIQIYKDLINQDFNK